MARAKLTPVKVYECDKIHPLSFTTEIMKGADGITCTSDNAYVDCSAIPDMKRLFFIMDRTSGEDAAGEVTIFAGKHVGDLIAGAIVPMFCGNSEDNIVIPVPSGTTSPITIFGAMVSGKVLDGQAKIYLDFSAEIINAAGDLDAAKLYAFYVVKEKEADPT